MDSIMKNALYKIVEAFNTGDLSEVDSIFAPTYIDHQKPPHIDVDGPEEFKRIVTGARQSEPFKVTIEDIIEGDNKIVARLRWQGIDPHGKVIDRDTIDILHFENGMVVEHWGAEIRPDER